MKRSEINGSLKNAMKQLEAISFKLPVFAAWTFAEWQARRDRTGVIRETMLGWDVTDFGMHDFDSIGAVLFTIRNGIVGKPGMGTPYAEKLICLTGGQRLPLHYHAVKTEDIITRGGLVWMELYNAKQDGGVDYETPVQVYCDGILRTFNAGERFEVVSGGSVTLRPRLYHRFGAVGDAVAGEVSSVNDDRTDNYWAEAVRRFADIIEDEAPLCPLCNEYEKW